MPATTGQPKDTAAGEPGPDKSCPIALEEQVTFPDRLSLQMELELAAVIVEQASGGILELTVALDPLIFGGPARTDATAPHPRSGLSRVITIQL